MPYDIVYEKYEKYLIYSRSRTKFPQNLDRLENNPAFVKFCTTSDRHSINTGLLHSCLAVFMS